MIFIRTLKPLSLACSFSIYSWPFIPKDSPFSTCSAVSLLPGGTKNHKANKTNTTTPKVLSSRDLPEFGIFRPLPLGLDFPEELCLSAFSKGSSFRRLAVTLSLRPYLVAGVSLEKEKYENSDGRRRNCDMKERFVASCKPNK